MPKRKTQEQFEKDVFDKLGPDYELLGPYPGGHGKVPMRHIKCGNEFLKNVHDIITKGSGCPFCNGTKPQKYNEQWVINNTPEPYQYLSGYEAMSTKCLFHCKKCDSDFYQTPSRLINQHLYGCNCQSTKKWTHESFLNTLGKECLLEYDVLEQYQNTDTKLRFKHKVCGTEFELTPYKFIYRHNKKYCPICYYNKSHGEILIDTYLTNINIDYQRQFSFPDFPKRFFDFYIPSLRLAIEFDGQQHYEFSPFFHRTQEEFQKRQQIDVEKNQYCLNKDIMLLRIPYTETDNLNTILKEIFEEKSSTTIERFLVKN